MNTWVTTWLTNSINIGTDIATELNLAAASVQERGVNAGMYWPNSNSADSGVLFPGPSAKVPGEFNVFAESGGAPNTASKLFTITNTAVSINKALGITGNTTVTGNLDVSGTLTAGTFNAGQYVELTCSMEPVYDNSISSYVWPISGYASTAVAVPNAIANATLIELRVGTGVQNQLNPMPITVSVRTPTWSGDTVSASTLVGSTQDLSFAHNMYGRRITSGFTCPTALTAGQEIRFTVDATLANRGGSVPNNLSFTVVLLVN